MKLENTEDECEEVRDALIALYVNSGMPSFEHFKEFVDKHLADVPVICIKKIVDAGKKALEHIEKINEFVHEIRNFPTRKDIADAINRNRKHDSALAFCLLDGKLPTDKQYYDLIKQNI